VPADADWNESDHPIVRVSREQLAELLRRGRRFIIF
jgi:hypothetical protein